MIKEFVIYRLHSLCYYSAISHGVWLVSRTVRTRLVYVIKRFRATELRSSRSACELVSLSTLLIVCSRNISVWEAVCAVSAGSCRLIWSGMWLKNHRQNWRQKSTQDITVHFNSIQFDLYSACEMTGQQAVQTVQKTWAFIRSWSSLCHYNHFYSSKKAFC